MKTGTTTRVLIGPLASTIHTLRHRDELTLPRWYADRFGLPWSKVDTSHAENFTRHAILTFAGARGGAQPTIARRWIDPVNGYQHVPCFPKDAEEIIYTAWCKAMADRLPRGEATPTHTSRPAARVRHRRTVPK